MTGTIEREETRAFSGLRFIAELIRAYPRRSAIMLVSLTAAALAEGLSLATAMPLLAFAAGDDPGSSALERAIFGGLDFVGLPATFAVLLAVVVVAVLLKAVLVLFANVNVGYVVAAIAADHRLAFIDSLMAASWTYFKSQRIGSLANTLNREVQQASGAYKEACMIIAYALQVSAYLVVSYLLSWQFTTLAIVAGLVMVLLFRRIFRATRRIGKRQARIFDTLSSQLADGLRGIKPLKAMAADDRLGPLLREETKGLNVAMRQEVVVGQLVHLGREPIAAIFLAATLLIAVGMYQAPLASVLVGGLMFYRTVNWIGTILVFFQSLTLNEAYYRNVRARIGEAVANREFSPGTKAPVFADKIELRNVVFAYQDQPILNDVSFTIEAGQITTLFGPSGSGKTTTSDLVLGLLSPDHGAVLVDGVSLAEIDLKRWRRKVGYVPQETYLFHDTIENNVTLGDPQVTPADLERALRDAEMWEFVQLLPQGVQTVVGEHGSMVSGGERQRLSLARALVRRPSLLILDEPTTALDPVTEQAICTTLSNLRGSVTVFAISHQPALAATADIVYRIEAGKIVATTLGATARLRHAATARA